jgi:hypothetical protein
MSGREGTAMDEKTISILSRQMHRRWRGSLTGVVVLLLTVLFFHDVPLAAPTLLTFEELPAGTTVTTQYGAQGVVFEGAFVGTDMGSRSGTRALRSVPPTSEIFNPVPFVMSFTSPQRRITLFATSPGVPRSGTLQGFDANGVVVAQDGPKQVAADAFTTMFEVKSSGPRIMRVVLQLEGGIHYAIDDLEFDGSPAEPPPAAPQVVITSPQNGAQLDTQMFSLDGTITGQGLLSTAKATIEYGRPPDQTAPPFTTALSVVGTGTTRQFTLPGGFNGVPLGPIKITVEAENFAAVKGTATTTITNLPQPIRDRAASEGAATLGDFRFGVFPEGCKVAVYQNAAISAQASGTDTFVIRGDILVKWISERARLGCPLAEERERTQFSFEGSNWCIFVTGTNGPCEAPNVPGRVQNFAGGRIYSTSGIGTFYTPTVFVDAIDKRGGEAVTGVPVADPTSSPGVMETWLFQRFVVPELPTRLPSTLEIRGTPARLYMERQSGHLIDPFNRKPLETTGTIWEHFPCDNNLGPCTVEPTAPQPDPIPNPGDEFCFGSTLVSTFLTGFGPRAWEPVLGREPFFGQLPLTALRPIDKGNFISTPLFGVVTFAKLADVDLTLIHEWCYGEDWIPLNCYSDWIYRIRPYGAHVGTGKFGSLYGGTKDNTTVKIEYERYYSDAAIWLGLPLKGDLMFTAGRWVIDCAHNTYKTELHPIFMFAKMRTITTRTDPFTKIVDPNPFGGTPDNPVPATQADIWVNGWYPGDPIEFDLSPPPRPHADATLVVDKPVDAQAAFGLNFESKLEPGPIVTRVHIRITAPLRRNDVTWLGEMKWQHGRGYQGQWYLYWAK